jgi:sigma-B regulation protein RsbQ
LPQSTYHALEATGHCPHLTHPDEIIRAIRSYLECPAGAPTLSIKA